MADFLFGLNYYGDPNKKQTLADLIGSGSAFNREQATDFASAFKFNNIDQLVGATGQQALQYARQASPFVSTRNMADKYVKLPDVFNSSDLSSGGGFNYVNPQTQNNLNLDGIFGAFDTSFKSLQDYVNNLNSTTTAPLESERGGLASQLKDALAKLVPKGQAQLNQLENYGFSANVKQLQQLLPQIAQAQAALTQGLVNTEGKVIPMQSLVGEKANLQAQGIAKVGALTSIAQALQGNIALAQDTAKTVVDLQFAPIQQEIDNLKTQLDLNSQDLTRADAKKAEQLKIYLDERTRLLDEEKQNRLSVLGLAQTAAQNGADTLTLNQILDAQSPQEAIKLAGSFLSENDKEKYISVGKDSIIFDPNTETFIQNPFSDSVNNSPATKSNRLALIAQLGKMIYGSRISDAEREFMTDIIDSKLRENPDISNADLRLSLMKELTGFEVSNNQDIAQGLMDTILQSSGENGIADFDMTGLATLLNNNNVSGAITKVENYALNKQRQLDPQNYFGEAGATTTYNFSEEIAEKLETLGYDKIGNFKGTIEQWLGRFKGTAQQEIAADIVNAMANWRLRFAGSAVTPTEMAFLSDAMPKITDRADQMAVKLNSLQQAAILQYNNTRASINLPQLNEEQLLSKEARALLYQSGTETTFESIISPEYLQWLGTQSSTQSLDPLDRKNLFRYYKTQNPGVDNNVIIQAIEDGLSQYQGFNSVGGDTNSAPISGNYKGLPMFDTFAVAPDKNRSDRNNNPGNIKVSDYTKTFAGVRGVEKKRAEDGGYFLVFNTPQDGLNAIGRLLKEGKPYKGISAEAAIKKYNGGGAYGARTLGLDPKKDFQSQIKDPRVLKKVLIALARAEGYTLA